VPDERLAGMDKNDWYFAIATALTLLSLLGLDWNVVKGRIPVPNLTRRNVIFLSLILGSLVLCGVGWHRSLHQDEVISALEAKNAALVRVNLDLSASLDAVAPQPILSQEQKDQIIFGLAEDFNRSHPSGPDAASPAGLTWINEQLVKNNLPFAATQLTHRYSPQPGGVSVRGNVMSNTPIGVIANGEYDVITGNTQINGAPPPTKPKEAKRPDGARPK
jgi:hypothetical protein